MPDLVVLYEVLDDGTPRPVVSSADGDVVRAVTKVLATKLGLGAEAGAEQGTQVGPTCGAGSRVPPLRRVGEQP